MASIKLKFRPSSVKGKKGVLSYQIIHYRLTRLIKTSYRIMPSEWDDSTGSLLISTQSECKARLLLIRDQTNWEMTRLQGIINDLERTGQASHPIRRLSTLQSAVFLINSRSHLFSETVSRSRCLSSHGTTAHLLPKLRCQFAEFLLPSSLKRLSIFSSPTSVGLRYGPRQTGA